jgi:hypothetical protein
MILNGEGFDDMSNVPSVPNWASEVASVNWKAACVMHFVREDASL